MSKEVMAGYKLIEVGVIPNDWEVKPLKRLSPSQSVGLVINPSSYFDDSGTVPMLVGSHIHENGINYESANRISEYSNNLLPASRLSTGDIVTVRVGYPGVTAVIPPELDGCNCASMMIVRQHHSFLSLWLCYVMNSRIGRSQIENVQYGTAQKQFNISDAVNFLYPVPPIPEQQAIASVLSDTDTLIASLDKLIAKKRDIKQAAMQQLLTGKQRLEGFGGDWEIRQLGDVAERIIGGGTPSRSNNTFWDGEIPWVTVKDFASFNPYYSQEFITKEGLKNSSSNLIPKGTVITSTRMALGKAVIYSVDVSINQDLKAIIPKQTLDSLYLYYWFQYQSEYIDSLGSGSTVKGILLQDLKKLEFLLPTIEEQQAIAKVLSDMDSDIIALEQRRDKTKAIKQAMMQELLTGRIRLLDTHTLAIPKD
jgi:type I restriction enzyme S subunit